MTTKNLVKHAQRETRLAAKRDCITRSFRRSSYARNMARTMIARAYETMRDIHAEIEPKLARLREVESYAANGTRCENQGYVYAGEGLATYRALSGDNGNGMEDNCPLWTTGHALKDRDSVPA